MTKYLLFLTILIMGFIIKSQGDALNDLQQDHDKCYKVAPRSFRGKIGQPPREMEWERKRMIHIDPILGTPIKYFTLCQ